jgi:hypothetical protein
MNDKCPCINCICVPRCRHKEYLKVFDDCDILKSHIPRYYEQLSRSADRIDLVQKALNPTEWYYGTYLERPGEPILVLEQLVPEFSYCIVRTANDE